MFKKVLIAEDHEIANISVQKTLQELGIVDTKYVYYCDDALTWIRNAIRDGDPYDLLITDLSFEDDYNAQHLSSGIDLIKAVKMIQPQIKIMVFSAENRSSVIEELFKIHDIDAYVRKARRDAQHLRDALQNTFNDRKYQSPDVKQAMRDRNTHEFSVLDVGIVSLLSQGVLQKNIPQYLQEKGIKPSGLSSVEKRLGMMKDLLGFSKNEQLVAYCKDIGII
ncbi:DNA-binding response regulator, NarL/FixJ family, contains REC and HTH domains [Sphingobacterium nematocida]|uniref:DNA-binding response regulator, NarL/FixJ family, contains REC and HTH domains n=1 Tax=Sphingobacterium nematocida TaxID=1513896 RepID=A0A1T5CQ44_9SPHI|nr:response regulator [Sphingobacterium nematocida]SKB61625.1 DNA-binding response regulator, NarL/FixJ family, contains REC and HTH domains [Sphingobacterium nematocida]